MIATAMLASIVHVLVVLLQAGDAETNTERHVFAAFGSIALQIGLPLLALGLLWYLLRKRRRR